MLLYADLDNVEEIIKPNYLVMRVEKKSCVPKCAVRFKYKLQRQPGALVALSGTQPGGEGQVLSVPTRES